MMNITTTTTSEGIEYAAIVDDVKASFILIDPETRKVCNVETAGGYTRQGLATALWEAANADGECFHDLEHHRTAEGDAFAHAVGGDTIDDASGFVAECGICCMNH